MDRVGEVHETKPSRIERDSIIAYALATNDVNPQHLDGRFAPPLYSVVPTLQAVSAARRSVYDGFTVHGEHDIRLHHPIEPGVIATARARVIGVHRRSIGTVLVTHAELLSQEGRLLSEQYQVSLAHGVAAPQTGGEPPPTPGGMAIDLTAPPYAELTYHLDLDQTRRYCLASGDHSAYTYDDAAATARGLPGAIMHGLCTMAFISRAVVEAGCESDSRRLRRLAVRFSRLFLMRAGQALTIRLWAAERQPGLSIFACEACDSTGERVLRNGWAEVAA
jgi:acyl dehydratase